MKTRAAPNIGSEKEAVAFPGHVRMTGLKSEEPITVAPQGLPDSPFSKRLSLIPYHRPGTPYRKVDPPGRETEDLETGIFDQSDDLFEIDFESERTLTEEPKEIPKFPISTSEMPEGITKRKLAPVILPFGVNQEKDSEKRLKANPGKDLEKRPKAPENLHIRPAPVMPELPCEAATKVPVVRSLPESPSESPLSTPPSSPSSPLSTIVGGPVAMGTV